MMLASSSESFMKGSRLLAIIARPRTPLLWAAGAAIVFTVVFGNLPGEGRYIEALQNSCHAPAFGVLTLITLTLLTRRAGTNMSNLLVQCITAVVAMGLLGAATELLQAMLGRDAEFDDVINDMAGSIAASGLWASTQLREAGRAQSRGRMLALLACLGAFAYWVTPLVICGSAYWQRHARFPVLAQFQSRRDMYFASSGGLDDRIVAVPPALAGGAPGTALWLPLDKGRWPGITLFQLVPDWRGYGSLILDLSNPGARPLELHLRVNDRAHDGAFDDRFNSILRLPARTRQRFTVPLQSIASGPHKRRMDMSHIDTLVVFHDGNAPGESFLVQRIALE
jgi:VanZ family protein